MRVELFGPGRTDRIRAVAGRAAVTVFVPAVVVPLTMAVVAVPAAAQNPFVGAQMYVDRNSAARRTADRLRRSNPWHAAALDAIAMQPVAAWIAGGGNRGDVRREVDAVVTRKTRVRALPVLVAYNIPHRDCGRYSAGGAGSASTYQRWIREFAAGLRGRRSVVILEPDALAGLNCLSPTGRSERIALLHDAVLVLRAAGAAVYIDAGHARWQSAEEIARRLESAGIAHATGFALNVSNFVPDAVSIPYGERVSRLVSGKPFVLDTSRNGVGTASAYDWCNPSGQGLGRPPTANTGHPGIHAFLWVKPPGESDGPCNGGPAAGHWWAEYAVELAHRSPFPLGKRAE